MAELNFKQIIDRLNAELTGCFNLIFYSSVEEVVYKALGESKGGNFSWNQKYFICHCLMIDPVALVKIAFV
jgi:hypothetical protein